MPSSCCAGYTWADPSLPGYEILNPHICHLTLDLYIQLMGKAQVRGQCRALAGTLVLSTPLLLIFGTISTACDLESAIGCPGDDAKTSPSARRHFCPPSKVHEQTCNVEMPGDESEDEDGLLQHMLEKISDGDPWLSECEPGHTVDVVVTPLLSFHVASDLIELRNPASQKLWKMPELATRPDLFTRAIVYANVLASTPQQNPYTH